MAKIEASTSSNSNMDMTNFSEGMKTMSMDNLVTIDSSEGDSSMDMTNFRDGSVTKFAEGMKFDTTGNMSMEPMVTITTNEGEDWVYHQIVDIKNYDVQRGYLIKKVSKHATEEKEKLRLRPPGYLSNNN